MRQAFTLLELLISVTLLSIIILFLYSTAENLRKANTFYKEKAHELSIEEKINKTLYLDMALSYQGSLNIQSIDPEFDRFTLQTANSVHHRYNPYVVYTVKNKKLYRIESLTQPTYPYTLLDYANVDELGDVAVFRIYKSGTSYIIDKRDSLKAINPIKIDLFNTSTAPIESNTTK